MSEKKDGPNRREFIEIAGLVGAAGAVGLVAAGCSGNGVGDVYADYPFPDMLDTAPDGPVLKAGLIGCGGRGTGAAGQFLSAGPNLEIRRARNRRGRPVPLGRAQPGDHRAGRRLPGPARRLPEFAQGKP